MCGIVGMKSPFQPISEIDICRMRDVFPYRGPDDKGCWINSSGHIALGHRRLSIIDPTSSGHQPMIDPDTGNVLVFNGEIYNYIEVRKELIARGCVFTTNTDTEVILKAYQVYGHDCLHHFNGMFAIALWDQNNNALFLARDRLGIKPLYYQELDSGKFLFGSEIKAIIAAGGGGSNLNESLIDQYMGFGYIPGEDCLQRGVKRLLPGHYAVLCEKKITINQYWDVSFDNTEDKGFDFYMGESRRLLDSAIDLRLRSDVPLGIFLSGGLDSSAVVGLLAQRATEQLKTFSVAFDFGSDYNETKYARMVAQKFKTDHREIMVSPDQFKDFIPKYISLMDEPVTESAAIALHFVSQLAKKEVTVVLSGEGSDEIFAGYDLYQYMGVIERYRNMVGGPLAKLIASAGNKLLSGNSKITKYLNLSALPLEQRYKGISTYDDRYKKRLYRPEFFKQIQDSTNTPVDQFLTSLFEKTKGKDALSRMLYFDTKTWLVDDLLIKADRMSMASSLELRVPFLDYRLVEFASKMPSKYKIKGRDGKNPLKRMMADILPNEIIYRKKMGFPTPLKLMFQGGLQGYTRDLLLDGGSDIHSYFKKSAIENILNEHSSGKVDHHRVLWQLVVLQEWLANNRKMTAH